MRRHSLEVVGVDSMCSAEVQVLTSGVPPTEQTVEGAVGSREKVGAGEFYFWQCLTSSNRFDDGGSTTR